MLDTKAVLVRRYRQWRADRCLPDAIAPALVGGWVPPGQVLTSKC